MIWLLVPAVAVFFLLVFLFYLRSPGGRGKLGEWKTAHALRRNMERGDRLFNDLTLVNPETGLSTQIDHILISTRGIYVIETKNLSGEIVGRDDERTWRQILAGGKIVHELHSPVKQNATHVFVVKKILQTHAFLGSIVVFVKADLRGVESSAVCSLQGLGKMLRGATPLTCAERDRYAELLKSCKGVSRRKHKRDIRTQKKRLARDLCPRCGAPLVLRQNRDDPQKHFYGCSNFPKCKFTKDV